MPALHLMDDRRGLSAPRVQVIFKTRSESRSGTHHTSSGCVSLSGVPFSRMWFLVFLGGIVAAIGDVTSPQMVDANANCCSGDVQTVTSWCMGIQAVENSSERAGSTKKRSMDPHVLVAKTGSRGRREMRGASIGFVRRAGACSIFLSAWYRMIT